MIGFSRLRDAGVLGINRRNAEYTMRWNERRFYPRVDDKLQTKRLCEAAGIPIPALLATAAQHFALRALGERLEALDSFVLKPAHGAMGNGIVVVIERRDGRFRRTRGQWITRRDLIYHASSIISGLYALGGQSDVAIVEERLEVHPDLLEIASQGVPDIRVIVYRGIPVMAMMRLPTNRSGGRANLHQGALGAGLDLATGRTVHAMQGSHSVATSPDTGRSVIGRTVPDFARVVDIAVAATDATGLGYVGADVVVDARKGPMILELNARPGLAIQIANLRGLVPRLQAVERCWRPDLSRGERIALGTEIARSTEPRA